MSRRFQFSLSGLLMATGLAPAALGVFLVATRTEPPISIGIAVAACATLGAAVGSLFRLTVEGAFWGLLAGAALLLSMAGF